MLLYNDTLQLPNSRSCSKGTIDLAHTFVCKSSSSDGNMTLFFDTFYCAQRYVLSKQRGGEESILLYVAVPQTGEDSLQRPRALFPELNNTPADSWRSAYVLHGTVAL